MSVYVRVKYPEVRNVQKNSQNYQEKASLAGTFFSKAGCCKLSMVFSWKLYEIFHNSFFRIPLADWFSRHTEINQLINRARINSTHRVSITFEILSLASGTGPIYEYGMYNVVSYKGSKNFNQKVQIF